MLAVACVEAHAVFLQTNILLICLTHLEFRSCKELLNSCPYASALQTRCAKKKYCGNCVVAIAVFPVFKKRKQHAICYRELLLPLGCSKCLEN